MDNHILTQKNNLLAVLFRIVPTHGDTPTVRELRFRAVLFRMVPKLIKAF